MNTALTLEDVQEWLDLFYEQKGYEVSKIHLDFFTYNELETLCRKEANFYGVVTHLSFCGIPVIKHIDINGCLLE